MAIVANLVIDQGSAYSTDITVMNAEGQIFNLAGYTAQGQLRKTYGSSRSYDFTVTVSNAAAGIIEATMSSAVTETIKPGRYVYDIEIVDGSGSTLRVVEGQVEVTPNVTRD